MTHAKLRSEASDSDLGSGIAKTRTGISGFDGVANGGLPTGRPTLICGAAGCGKTLFAVEFLAHGATEFDEPGVMVSFEESSEEIRDNVRSIGIDISRLVEERKLALDFIEIPPGAVQAGDFDLEGLFARIEHAVASVGAKRLVLDTLELLFGGFDESIVRAELNRLLRWTKHCGLTTVITAEKGHGELTRYGLEEYVSDCVIQLEHQIVDRVSSRRLRIVKYRGTSHGADVYPVFIDEYGFAVLPMTQAAFATPASQTRISTGFTDLDTLFGGEGGVFRGSGVLLSGGSGSGKSTLANHFAGAAAARGERVVVFAFEESPQQIARNMRSVNLDLQPLIDSGRLSYEAQRPSLQGLEAHLVRMQRCIERANPSVVVVDPISALMHAGPSADARGALIRLADHLKSRGTTAVFTALGGAGVDESTFVYVSSVMDTWIQLKSIESAGERNRGLHVLKSRGVEHSNQIHEFVMSNAGISLLEPTPGAVGMTGSERIAHVARLQAKRRVRVRDIEAGRAALERKRRAVQSQIESLQAEFDAEAEQLRALLDTAEITDRAEATTNKLVAEHVSAPGQESETEA